MTCNVYDFKKDTYCGEPDFIKGCCQDHIISCSECGVNPAHPHSEICWVCRKREYMKVEDMNEVHWEELPDYGDLMTLDEFQSSVDVGLFIDYDGHGRYATESKMSRFETWPSKFKINRDNRFSHIVWFNR